MKDKRILYFAYGIIALFVYNTYSKIEKMKNSLREKI
jgi:hypothetical protein